MGDSRNEKGYEMAPQSDDPEKGGVEGTTPNQDTWTGLGKEELLRVADTPAWNWTRNILLILFWVGWVGMLVAAIVIVIQVPRCPEVEWWEKSVLYQVFPRSLQDADGDGVGDLKGVTQRLDHFESIGAKALYLNSIYEERNNTVDVGYDITDFKAVDASLGSIEALDELVSAASGKDMKVVLEFVPNHSSDQHPWFVDSRKSKDSEFSDFYVWADGVNVGPPNDWKNAYGETAWVYGEERNQYYYAYFCPEQPDLNYNNDTLREEILNILSFWLVDHKVDGFVFSHVDYIFEPPVTTSVKDVNPAAGGRRRRQATPIGTTVGAAVTTAPTTATMMRTTVMKTEASAAVAGNTGPENTEPRNTQPMAEPGTTNHVVEPESVPSKPMPAQYDFLGDGGSMVQEKLLELLAEWRKLLNDESYLGKYRLMVAQSNGPINQVAKMYGVNGTYLVDYPLNTGFLDIFDGELSGTAIHKGIKSWLEAKAAVGNGKRWNTWMLGCHDRSRIATRAGAQYVDALNAMLLTLPGTPVVYYGEEIGMMDVAVPVDQAQDRVVDLYPNEQSRDPERTPMPWDNSTNAGFTWENATAYMPLPGDFVENNVEVQSNTKQSSLELFKKLAELHLYPSLVAGKFTPLVSDADVFSYFRQFGEWPRYLVVINVGSDATHNLYAAGADSKLPSEGKVVLSTMDPERKGKESLESLKTKGGEALVIKLE